MTVDSNATTTEDDGFDDSTSSDIEYDFRPLLDTPDVEELTKTLKGKSTEPLVSVVVAHPNSITKSILGQATKMLDKRNKITQKN